MNALTFIACLAFAGCTGPSKPSPQATGAEAWRYIFAVFNLKEGPPLHNAELPDNWND